MEAFAKVVPFIDATPQRRRAWPVRDCHKPFWGGCWMILPWGVQAQPCLILEWHAQIIGFAWSKPAHGVQAQE